MLKVVIYLLLAVVFVLFLILIVGWYLPKTRTLTKEIVLNAVPEGVYKVVVNNSDWKYRSSLDDLKVVETSGDFEVWDEVSDGNTIRFRTKEKRPYSFYSFEMESKLFRGNWWAEFEAVENGQTRFMATESIEYRNLFIKVLAYLFMDLDGYMETYQDDLRRKVEGTSNDLGNVN